MISYETSENRFTNKSLVHGIASDLTLEVDDLLIHIWPDVCLIPATLEHSKSHVIALDVRISTANAILQLARFIGSHFIVRFGD